MKDRKKKIGLYQTGEYGTFLFHANLTEALICTHNENAFDIVPVHPPDIQNADFMNDLAGLAMPGRNEGQQYRNEWTDIGYQNIKHAVDKCGLNILAVCAASTVLCQTVHWHNSLQSSSNKHVENENALFPGAAIGAFENLWINGYRSKATVDAYQSNVLFAKVLPVHYTRELSGQTDGSDAYGLYWGGCVFVADKDIPLRVLASHNNRVSIPVVDAGTKGIDSSEISSADFINPSAVIEFSVGKGQVIFSNIHPETTGKRFAYLFQKTPKATQNAKGFAQDKEKMLQADPFSHLIFERFVSNCVKTIQNGKKHLVMPEVNS